MIEDLLNSFTSFLQNIGNLSYLIVGLIFFAESIVFVGLIIPGALVAILLGALAAQGIFQTVDIIVFATIGFILGDCLSFFIGQRGTGLFSDGNRLLKEAHLEKGQAFFTKHGNKSVILGRYIGFLRPMTAFIAGLSQMTFYRFFVLNLISALSWTVIHVMFGYFFGQALGLIKIWLNRIEMFTLVAVILFGIFYFLKWLFVRKGEQFWLALNDLLKARYHRLQHSPRLEKFVQKNERLIGIIHRRITRQKFTGFPLTIITIISTYFILLLVGLVENLINSDPISKIDQWLETILIAFRQPELVKIFLVITVLAKFSIIIILVILFSVFLWRLNQKKFISGLWLSVGGAAIFSYIIKITIERPRPLSGVYDEISFSFPSAHAALAVAFYGFILYWLWRRTNWSRRVNLVFSWFILVFLIGFSRLFLGVHYLSDVIGGYILGSLWLLVGIGLSEWHLRLDGPSDYFKPLTAKMWRVAYSLVFLAMIGYTVSTISYLYGINIKAVEPQPIIMSANLSSTLSKDSFSHFAETIDGTIEQPLNVLIVASSSQVVTERLTASGWLVADKLSINSLKKTLGAWLRQKNYNRAPINPSFWQGGPNELAFEKPLTGKNRQSRWQLRLWDAKIITMSGQQVFVGTASQDTGRHFWIFGRKILPEVDLARDQLINDLKQKNLSAQSQQIEWIKSSSTFKTVVTDGMIYLIAF